ncbi:MAG: hypothetical protein Q8N14_05590, partial [Candidatus Omnitrophota bacterium]|nr:hypothetical protein [Candidatus Omnitrophota bacterium]
MGRAKVRKPSYIKEPQEIAFKVVNQPLEEVKDLILNKLERNGQEPKSFYFLLESLLTVSFQSYKAIRKLVAKDPKYPTQAHILSRSLVDALFVILRLTEKPGENSRAYELAGYLEVKIEYEREAERYGENKDD